MDITFSATATITQTIEITKKGLTLEQLKKGLNSGDFLTSLSSSGSIISIPDYEEVAIIKAQAVTGDYSDVNSPYTDFE